MERKGGRVFRVLLEVFHACVLCFEYRCLLLFYLALIAAQFVGHFLPPRRLRFQISIYHRCWDFEPRQMTQGVRDVELRMC